MLSCYLVRKVDLANTFWAASARAPSPLILTLLASLGAQALGACADSRQDLAGAAGHSSSSAGSSVGPASAGSSSANAGHSGHVASAGAADAASGAPTSDGGEAGEADAGAINASGGSGGSTGGSAPAGSGGTPAGSGGTPAGSGGTSAGGAGGSGNAGTASVGGEGGAPAVAGGGGAAGACNGVHGCPEPVVVGPSSKAWGVALDPSYVYWTTLEVAGSVRRAPLDGGLVETIATDEPQPFDIAVANGTVFWCTADAVGHVVKAPAAGGPKESFVTGVGNGTGRVIADGTQVYYLTNYNVVMKVPSAGGTPVTLSAGPTRSNITDLALSAGQLYWANSGVWNTAYTLKEPGTAGIARVNIMGTPQASSLVTQLDYPQFSIAVDDAHVFWSDQKAIYRTGLLGGAYSTVASLTSPPVSAVLPTIHVSPIVDLVSDGNNLYFADAHQLYRVSVSGGTPEVVSWGWSGIQQLAVNANAVYFTDGVAGVVKLVK